MMIEGIFKIIVMIVVFPDMLKTMKTGWIGVKKKKKKIEHCFPSFFDIYENVNFVENEDGTFTDASVYGIIAIITSLYLTFCVNSGPTPAPAPAPAQNAPVPAPAQNAPIADDNFPDVRRGGSTTDLAPAVKNSVKNGIYNKSGLIAILQQDNPIPDVDLKGLNPKPLVELIRKWHNF